jgi:regulation of enolase protein 1 (concanavalin A-like superfamily)
MKYKTLIFAFAATAMTALAEPAVTSQSFEQRNGPVNWKAQGPDSLSIEAGPKTNWFVPPWNAADAVDNAPTLLLKPMGDFSLSAKVRLDPRSRWDSGALTVFVDKNHWGKLCLENANGDGKLAVVMVVNKNVSDDSYTDLFASDNALYLKITRKGQAFFFNASADGKTWRMFRAFSLDTDLAPLRVGLLAQSPTGDGIHAEFSDIRYEKAP